MDTAQNLKLAARVRVVNRKMLRRGGQRWGQVEGTRIGRCAGVGRCKRGLYWVYWIEYSRFSTLGQPEDGARPTGRFDKGDLLADVTSPSDVSSRYEANPAQNYYDLSLNTSLEEYSLRLTVLIERCLRTIHADIRFTWPTRAY